MFNRNPFLQKFEQILLVLCITYYSILFTRTLTYKKTVIHKPILITSLPHSNICYLLCQSFPYKTTHRSMDLAVGINNDIQNAVNDQVHGKVPDSDTIQVSKKDKKHAIFQSFVSSIPKTVFSYLLATDSVLFYNSILKTQAMKTICLLGKHFQVNSSYLQSSYKSNNTHRQYRERAQQRHWIFSPF